jgi:Bacteriophage HK97-gp10, putative tail-component
MGVAIKGQKKLVQELEKRLGKEAFRRLSDNALKAGADIFVQELKQQLETFRDTGETIDEVTIADPETIGGVRVLRVHWKGPMGRYRVVHLNEWGTVKNPNPRGKGAIARALKNSEKAYRAALKKSLQEEI